MAKHQKRQALALSARLTPNAVTAFEAQAFSALEEEMARHVAMGVEKRSNGGASFHIFMKDDRISGFVKDANTLVRFADGAAAVSTHG